MAVCEALSLLCVVVGLVVVAVARRTDEEEEDAEDIEDDEDGVMGAGIPNEGEAV